MAEHDDVIIVGTGAGRGERRAYAGSTSFFPSIGAVNPALTAMAAVIRVEHLSERLA
jgi:hypothetical protein